MIETNVRQRGTIAGSDLKMGRIIKELERIYGVSHGGDRKSSLPLADLKSQEELAEELGISVTQLIRVKKLAELPEDYQQMILDGIISTATASRVIARLSEPDQLALLKQIQQLPAAQKFTQAQVQTYIDQIKGKDKQIADLQAEVRVMTVQDALHQLKLEISENENRKDFTFSEKMDWAERLKEEYSKIAEANQKSGTSVTDVTQVGRVDQKVAEAVGLGSYGKLRKAEYIRANADEEMIRQLDEGQLSINGAYVRLKKQAEEAETKLLEKDKQIADLQAEAAVPLKIDPNFRLHHLPSHYPYPAIKTRNRLHFLHYTWESETSSLDRSGMSQDALTKPTRMRD
ncbi:MAG: hypothetical protein VB115_14470 [Christensenellaceae bacterium]|nr:hypothetical protein [Christensenellaceae bacterium]